MYLKGIDKLREKLPDYPGNRIGLIPLRGIIAGIIGYVFLVILDILPRSFSDITIIVAIEPFMPILGTTIIAVLALWLIRGLWSKRDSMKAELGDLAYQKMIKRGVTGVFLIPPLVFHTATSIRSLPPGPPVNELTTQWSQSLLAIIGVPLEIDLILRFGFSLVLIVIGVLLVRSSVLTFGIDYMTVVYLYFPEESEVQEHEIYSVVRHPAYLAGVILGAAAFVFRFSVYSFILFLVVYLTFRLHIITEENELVQRFGDGYREYMKKVPAFLVRPRSLGKFFRFLRK